MSRSLSLTMILIALVGCSSNAAEGERATSAALSDGDRGDDLASIADDASDTGDVDGMPFVAASEGGYQSGRSGDIQFVVIHDIEGSGRSGVETFRASDAKVSAHYVIDKFGVGVQMVREGDSAYHSGNSLFNGTAIGIEHSGVAAEDGYTAEEYAASAKLVASIVTRYKIPIDRKHIVGHSQVPSTEDQTEACEPEATDCGGRNHHDDPGPHWDWDGYLAQVQAAADALAKDTPTTTTTTTTTGDDPAGGAPPVKRHWPFRHPSPSGS